MRHVILVRAFTSAIVLLASIAFPTAHAQAQKATLNDQQIDNLVRRSYQYVAMYNVIHKLALKYGGRWNVCEADSELKDHT